MTAEDSVTREIDVVLDSDLDSDALFDVLSNDRRRSALSLLDGLDAPTTLADLADAVATRERDVPGTEVPPDAVESIHLELYHVHVPKMEHVGLVEYSRDPDSVSLTDEGTALASRLRPPGQRR